MKNLFTLIALSSGSLLSAQYYQPYDSSYDYDYSGWSNQPTYYDGYSYQQPNYSNQQWQQGSRGQRAGGNFGYQKVSDPLALTDQEVTKKVYDELKGTKAYKDVAFKVSNGNVNLAGNVDSQDTRNKLDEAVRKVEGVKGVNNQIRILEIRREPNAEESSRERENEKNYPQDYAANESDRKLNEKIRNELNGGWFSRGYKDLVIRTNDGVVTINGSVDRSEDVQKINDQVKNIAGVRRVITQLSVKNR